jgi:uncharacterized integral membrane protein
MSTVHRNRARLAHPTSIHRDLAGPAITSPPAGRAPRTRTGTAWLAVCTVGTAALALIVFMLQNSRSADVSFVWLHGSVPLTRSLVIAGIGIAILAMSIGGARIGQLPGLARRRRGAAPRGPAVQP